MALDPLATVADIEARGVTVDPGDVGTLTTFLGVASAAVREAAGCPIAPPVESTVVLEGSHSTWLTLPGLPVVSVQSVTEDGAPVTDFRLASGRLWRRCGWSYDYGPSLLTVTYTHGLAEPPADIVDMVCRLALSGLIAAKSADDGSDLAASRVWQERIGDYFVMYRQDTAGVSEIELPQALAERLRARFGGGAALLMSR